MSKILFILIKSYCYFLLVICNTTKATQIRFLKTKLTTNVLLTLLDVKVVIKKETKNKVVYVKYNNKKGEFG